MKKNIQLYLPYAIGLSLSLLASCTSGYNYKRPESIENKIGRFESHHSNVNTIPEMEIAELNITKGRGPASKVSPAFKSDNTLKKLNIKRLYFLSLISQYDKLKSFSTSTATQEIKYCPNFHTSFLNYKEQFEGTNSKKYSYKVPHDNTKTYPEFYLPLTTSGPRPRVIDFFTGKNLSTKEKTQTLAKAINIHISKTYAELTELCDSSSSHNYYIFENLMTHVRTQGQLPKSNIGVKTLLKTTIFSNITLLDSLKRSSSLKKSRGIASMSRKSLYTSEVKNRLKVNWADDYFSNE